MSNPFKFSAIALLIGLTAGALPQALAAGEQSPRTEKTEESTKPAARQLHQIFDEYSEANKALNPIMALFQGDMRFNDQFGDYLSKEYLAKSRQLDQTYLDKLETIDVDQLDRQDRLSYQIFKLNREQALEAHELGFAYKETLIPFNQFFGVHNFFAMLGSGQSAQPFNTVEDYDNWLKRAKGFGPFVDRAIGNMRIGIREGVVQPTIVMEKVLPQLEAQVVPKVEESVFYMPVKSMPESFPKADQKRLRNEYRKLIESDILPAYQRLHGFIKNEYMDKTRETVGLSALPDGKRWYELAAKTTTTTDLTPDEIHEIGLRESRRLFAEMVRVKEQVGFKGDMQAFFKHLREDPQFYFDTPEQLLEGYVDLKARINPELPRLFNVFPKADYVVRPVEPFRERTQAAASYMPPAPDGSRPGVFYVNTYDLKSRPKYVMEALSIHEAAPGHHFQIAIAQELDGLPDFRRFGGFTAYIEGWGLYTESLGKDLGLYTDPYQYFGSLYFDIWRANRLVVDTGIHSKGWTREQAIEFMKSNSPVSETDVVAEVERYIAIPGQALAYKLGQLKIMELKQRSRDALGDKFDIREFHRVVLDDGALPLSILEDKVDRWIASQI